MKVMKLGGGCFRDADHFRRSASLITGRRGRMLVVVSAVYGVTDLLYRAIDSALVSEQQVPRSMLEIRTRHISLADELLAVAKSKQCLSHEIDKKVEPLERLLFGIAYTGEASASVRAHVVSYGERLAAILMAALLREQGTDAQALDADAVGVVTIDELSDNATADLATIRRVLPSIINPLLDRKTVPVVTGYFGRTPAGRIATFGRNGSDYAASVLAYALEADTLEIWKDVNGFMSADPKLLPGAQPTGRLSFYEAAELSYFGAKILHPRTVEPLVGMTTAIYMRNLFDPASPGTEITVQAEVRNDVIKSVTSNEDIALLRIHGPGVGFKSGIIGAIGDRLASNGVNIFSVLTSQTCINLLVDKEDAARGLNALADLDGDAIERVDLEDDVALVAVVGEGLRHTQGIAARVFSAVSREQVNVHMIASGASEIASYFVVSRADTEKAVRSVHREFFDNVGNG